MKKKYINKLLLLLKWLLLLLSEEFCSDFHQYAIYFLCIIIIFDLEQKVYENLNKNQLKKMAAEKIINIIYFELIYFNISIQMIIY